MWRGVVYVEGRAVCEGGGGVAVHHQKSTRVPSHLGVLSLFTTLPGCTCIAEIKKYHELVNS